MSVGKKELEWILNNLELSSDPTCWKALKLIQSQQSEIERLKAYEPKFKINDTKFIKYECMKEAIEVEIVGIHFSYYLQGVLKPTLQATYSVRQEFESGSTVVQESELFATKEEVEKK